MCHILWYQSDLDICLTYVSLFDTLFCISNIHLFNFSFSNLFFTWVDGKQFLYAVVTGLYSQIMFLEEIWLDILVIFWYFVLY